jgi:hypothetical protein
MHTKDAVQASSLLKDGLLVESVVSQYISDDLGLPNEEPKVDHLNGTTEKCAAGAA